MPARILIFLAIFQVCLLLDIPAAHADQPPGSSPSVLIINSYHPGFTWTDNEMQGLAKALRAARPAVDLQVEYMDAKRFDQPEVRQGFIKLLTAKLRGRNYPVVIATDNLALNLALDLRPQLFPAAQIVFCGVNGQPEDEIKGRQRVTGITETWDPAGTLKAIARLQPGVKEIVVLHDQTESGLGTRRNLETILPAFRQRFNFRFLSPRPVGQILKELASLPDTAAVLLMGYNIDSAGRVFDSAATGPLFAGQARVPVYTMDMTRFSGGVVGGSLLSGRRQGELAAAMAMRILAGESADAIPIMREPVAELLFDYAALSRFRLDSRLLPAGSRLINRPISLYEHYRYQIWALSAVIVCLIMLVVGLTLALIVRRRLYAERLSSQAAIAASAEKYRKIFENASEGIFQTTPAGRYLNINPAFARMFHYASPAEMMAAVAEIGNEIYVNPQEREEMARLLRSHDHIEGFEVEVYRKDRSRFWISINCHAVRDAAGQILYFEGTNQDINERKLAEGEALNLQHQLVQAQKMESIGRLAGGVAHDFNNMLSVIIGNAEIALEQVTDDIELRPALLDILGAAQRSAELTRQLLAFARKQVVSPKALDLNQTVDGMLKMLRRLIGEDIELVWKPAPQVWTIRIDPSQVDQILANLVVNARDAIDQTGRIIITTGNLVCDEAYCANLAECAPGEYTCLCLSDNGSGMDSQTLANIFEPFFTTKKEGHGTGLGLATVYGIVRQNGGFVSVYSEPGQGTTFKIHLPRCQEATQACVPEPQTSALPQGTETILIVEDEEAVLNLSRTILQNLGYNIKGVKRTDQALRIMREQPEKIDLLLTDVVMPDMNGRELFEQLAAIKPGLKCLYMSGYTDEFIARQGIIDEGVHFIAKPFALKELAAKVRRALE